ncbi:MAG: AAA family ATPase [Firmicutes bacterium]|nr:AAA family ATPase [Bacillota bacterium]
MNNDNIEILDFEDKPKEKEKFSVIKMYGEELVGKKYITNPAIARDKEIEKLMLVLLTPDKSALLTGKAGIGKTAIVEGLAYLIQRNEVPNALKGYKIIKINSTSLLGKITIDNNEEMVISILMRELKDVTKTILFIDEVHTLIGGKADGPMDLANILKPALDRGDIKAIGATTTEEYEAYIVRDRAFLRRFERIEVLEPSEETTVEILMKSIPRIEYKTGAHIKYTEFITKMLISSIVSATGPYKRVYGLAAMYPDVAFSVLSQAFSQAIYRNSDTVNILDFYNAIKLSKRIYPDTIIKELKLFKQKFKQICEEEKIVLPDVTIDEIKVEESEF